MTTCSQCKFWNKGEQWGDDNRGGCHRYAPHPTLGEYEYEQLKLLFKIAWLIAWHVAKNPDPKDFENWEESCQQVTIWPITEADQWCGEFLPAEPKNDLIHIRMEPFSDHI